MTALHFLLPLALVAGLSLPETALSQTAEPDSDLPDASILEKGPIGYVGLGFGYGTESGAAITAHARADGLLGDGQELGFMLRLGETGGNVDVNYLRFGLGGRDDLDFGLSLSGLSSSPTEDFDFQTDSVKLTGRLNYHLSDETVLSPYLTLSIGRISDIPTGSSALILTDEGRRNGIGIGTDLRRLFGAADSGRQTLVEGGVELGGSDRGHRYTALTFGLRHQQSIGPDGNFQLSASVNGGTMNSLQGTSHIGDRSILGQSSLRGFKFGGIGPRDLNVSGSPALGGNTFAVMRLEARARNLFKGEEARPIPGLFLDAGSLWGLDDTAGGPTGSDAVDDGFHLRATIGILVDLETRLGTFQVSFAHAIEKMDYDQTAPFNLSYNIAF